MVLCVTLTFQMRREINQNVDICRSDPELAKDFVIAITNVKLSEENRVLQCNVVLRIVLDAFKSQKREI
jgi:hypothetical protein